MLSVGGEHLAEGQVLMDDLGPKEGAQPSTAPEVTGKGELGHRIVVEGPTEHIHHR